MKCKNNQIEQLKIIHEMLKLHEQVFSNVMRKFT